MTIKDFYNKVKTIDVERSAKTAISKNEDTILKAFKFQTATGDFGKEYAKSNRKYYRYKYFKEAIPHNFLLRYKPAFYDYYVTGDFYKTFSIENFKFKANTDLYGSKSALKTLEEQDRFYRLYPTSVVWILDNSNIYEEFKNNLYNK